MPVYEYRCTSCNQIFEYQQRMADAAKTVCEACSGPLERLISRSAFQFKGGGWYKDLYSSAKPGAEATPSGGAPGAAATPAPAAPAASPAPAAPSTGTSGGTSGGSSGGTSGGSSGGGSSTASAAGSAK
jgi:putative FmdB family regulatory protein